MAYLPRAVARSAAARGAGLSTLRLMRRAMIFAPPPRVLANSVPKAGTHLLATLLRRLPQMTFSGQHHALNDFSASPGASPAEIPEVDEARLRRALKSVNDGQFVTAHFPAQPQVRALLEELGYRRLLMMRDPRDIVVSFTAYVVGTPRHALHRRYRNALPDDDRRLLATIVGFPGDRWGPGQESIGERLAKYVPWLDDDATLVCGFESLVGPAGGGDAALQRQQVARIARHVDRALAPERVEEVAAGIWSPASATFRRGVAGDWRSHFKDHHVKAFKDVAGEVLIRLGYERDLGW